MTITNTIALNAMCLENDLAKAVKVLKVPIPFSTTNEEKVANGDVNNNRSTNLIRKISRKAIPNAVAIRNPGKKQRVTQQDRRARFSRVPRMRLKVSFVPFPRATKEIGDVCTQAKSCTAQARRKLIRKLADVVSLSCE